MSRFVALNYSLHFLFTPLGTSLALLSIAVMSTDKELYKLELLSLVTKVSQELFNHTKLQDKNLAEFVIAVSLCAIRSAASY